MSNPTVITPRTKTTFTLAQAWLFACAFGAAVYGGGAKLHEIEDTARVQSRQLEAQGRQLEAISKRLEALQVWSNTESRWEWLVASDLQRLGKSTKTEIWTKTQP